MPGPVAERSYRLPPYSGMVVASLRLGAMLALGLFASGCAMSGGPMSGGLGGMFAKHQKTDDVQATALASEDVTSSASAPTLRASAAVSTSGLPQETDLVFARIAIVEVLQRGSKEVSAPWENPSSGARGTVTPIASAYARDGDTCHDFLASYVRRQGPERWLQGQACRGKAGAKEDTKQGTKQGAWEVKSLRPWTRS
jgi:hypothetical protein